VLNFLYCFDENYQVQAYVSILSVLEKSSEKINVDMICNFNLVESSFPYTIRSHSMLNELRIHKINIDNVNLYNLNEAHVTEATFYRLFLEDYIENKKQFVTYLDCDILCVEDPSKLINETINELNKFNKIAAFNPEISKNEDIDYFINLDLTGDKYFNAGVMIFDSLKWKKFNIKEKSLTLIPVLKDKAIFWDQDILNKLFDNNYLEMKSELNSRERKEINENIVFHHFSGKHKPWTLKGFDQIYSNMFHEYYKKLYNKMFYIEIKNLRNSFRSLLIILFKNFRVSFKSKLVLFLYFVLHFLKKQFKT